MIYPFPSDILNNMYNVQNMTFNDNDHTIYYYSLINRVLNLITSQYIYKGLPKSVKPYLIEYYLFWNGMCGITKTQMEWYAGSIAGTSHYDLNNELWKYSVVSRNGKVTVQAEQGVTGIFLKNNTDNIPTFLLLKSYFDKLTKIYFGDDNNLSMSNKKLAVEGKPEHYNAKRLEADMILSTSPYLFIDKDLKGTERFHETNINDNVINLQVTYEPAKYNTHWMNIYNNLLSIIGVDHNASFKAERNVESEVIQSSVETKLMFENGFTFRQVACEDLSNLLGIEITVESRQAKIEKEEQEKQNNQESQPIKGGGDDDQQ